METKTGTIIRIVITGQYGFLKPDQEGPDVFFNRIGVISPTEFTDLREGHHVCYLQSQDKKGRPRAIGITID